MLVPGFATYWCLMGVLNLAIMSWSDLRTMMIDDRFNAIMVGATIPLVTMGGHAWYYYLSVILFAWIVRYLAGRAFAEGDVNAFAWMFTGAGFIGMNTLIAFAAACVIMFGASFIGKNIAESVYKRLFVKIPYFPVLFGIFLVTVIAGGY